MRLHLVDGTFELFRAWFSKRPPHTAPEGWDAKATLGIASSMLALLSDPNEEVTHLAVAFDNPIRSFRNDLFSGYKTEDGVPRALLDQFDPAEEAMRALGIVVWSMDRWEADDALATGAARFADQVEQVRLLTPDKDLGQSIRGTHVVQVDRLRNKMIDEDGLRAIRGVGPSSIADLLALVGDAADGYPGLPGIGAKTAAALLAEFEHIESIPLDHRKWKSNIRGADKIARVLAEHHDEALLYKKLATLVTDVPLAESLEDLRWKGAPREAFHAFCDRLGATTIKSRPPRFC